MKTKRLLLVWLCLTMLLSGGFAQHRYGEVLQKSMFFYEAQQAGYLSENNRVSWRANSALTDGFDANTDLTGGWFDAGDHVKFNFPMAYSVTTLCWGYLENKDAYASAGQAAIFLENIKHATDYLLKCHTAPNELYAQVADGDTDHSYWVPAEVVDVRYVRESFKIDAANPGTDLAGETAAALAAASLAFEDADPAYSATLLQHAVQLYSFADNYRGKYSDVIPVGAFYKSWSGYQDELVWGAIWLYKATGDNSYLVKAESEYQLLGNEEREEVKSYGWTLAWDDKSYGCYVLMAQLTGDAEYNADAERHLDQWFVESASDGKGPKFTGAGFPILDTWGSFRYAANSAFLLLEQSDNTNDAAKRTAYRARAKEIVDYLLGDNPQQTSYVIGYGDTYPLYPHHRTAHGSWDRDEKLPAETRHILYGALVGGHKSADDQDWVDDRHDYYWNEVACDYNSLFTGVMARMYADFGGAIESGFPAQEIPNGEFLVETKLNSSGSTHSEYAVWVHNRTAWPARIPGLKFRIFINISEGEAAGYSASDYIITANTNNASISPLTVADAEKSIYYTEIEFDSDVLIYPGGQGESKEESQVRVRLPFDAPAEAWDPTNDWSYTEVGGTLAATEYIPLYADGELVFGREPGPIQDVPVTGISISPQSLELDKGETATISATVHPSNATNKLVTWSSDAPSIASVSSTGVVTGLEEGDAVITARTVDGGFTAICSVAVSDIVKPTYTLTVTSGANGSVEVSPIKVEYIEGEIVSLEAIADEGYRFEAWSGDLSGTDATTSIEMDSDKSVSASFVVRSGGCDNPETVSLPHKIDGVIETCVQTSGTIDYINSWGADEITINGVDITNLYVSQMPPKEDGKYTIYFKGSVGWSHIEIIGTSGPITAYDLTSEVVGNGSITPASGTYEENTEVTLEATPASGWKFDGWSGDVSGTSASTSVVMSSDKHVIATFSEIQNPVYYTLAVSVSEGGTVDPMGGEFLEGSTVVLTATPDAGYRLVGWNGIPDPSPVLNVLMDANKSITVEFEKVEGGCFDDEPMATALPSMHSAYNYIHVLGAGPDLSQIRDFTINWDLANNGLWQFSMNTNNGNPAWYVDLLPKVNHTLNISQPSLTISGSGIAGLDGEYWTVTDGENFALVSKLGGFTIYFSTLASSPCEKSAPADFDSFTTDVKLYPNPVSGTLYVENMQNASSIEILNTLGQVVLHQSIGDTDFTTVDVDHLQSGSYIMMVKQTNGQQKTKMFYVK